MVATASTEHPIGCKQQPIGCSVEAVATMNWLLVNASACVYPGFHPYATHATHEKQAIAFGWKAGLTQDRMITEGSELTQNAR